MQVATPAHPSPSNPSAGPVGDFRPPTGDFRPITFPVHAFGPGGKKKPAVEWGDLTAPVPVRPDQATGAKTGLESGFVVLDVDAKALDKVTGLPIDGAANLARSLNLDPGSEWLSGGLNVLHASGALPPTRCVRTISGGYHFYFRHPGGHVPNSAGSIAQGIDLRGDGGYVVIPPTPGYAWFWEGPMAPAPAWLLDRIARPSPGKTKAKLVPLANTRLPSTLAECCLLLRNAGKGTRNDLVSRVAFKAGAQQWPNAKQEIATAIMGWDPAYMATHLETVDRQLSAGSEALIHVNFELARMVEETEQKLGGSTHTFARQGELVSVFRLQMNATESKPVIHAIGYSTLKSTLSEVARFVRFQKDEFTGEAKATTSAIPADVVAALHELKVWPSLRVLRGLVESPCMRPDGSILTREGYDPATQLYHVPSVLIDVPEHPTLRDAQDAWGRIAYLFRDFPFVDASEVAVPMAAILTLLGRPAIDGPVPAFVFDASTRGSGKTLLAHVVSLIATGREAEPSTYPEGREAKEELEKVLGAVAMNGQQIVLFDNLSDGSKFGCGPLDRVLTATSTSFRVLGQSTQKTLMWGSVVMATGNNVVIAKDTSRRTLLARLEPREERPEIREGFALADLLGYVRANRSAIVRDALTILRGYATSNINAGIRIGSYEKWSAVVGGAVRWVSGINVLHFFPVQASQDEDPEEAAFRTLLRALPERFPNGVTARELAALFEDFDRSDLRDAIETIAGPTPTAKRIGNALRVFRGRNASGRRLAMRMREGINVWRVEGAWAENGGAQNSGGV